MKQKKDIRITLRLTQEQYKSISEKADAAQMTIGAYVRAAALRHKVVIVDGLREYTRELKGVGRSLNQLAILAHTDAAGRSAEEGAASGKDDRTGWEAEREFFFSAQNQTSQTASTTSQYSGIDLSADGGGSTASALVGLGHRLEQLQPAEPVIPARHYTDRKVLQKEREKKIALGHKTDDHEDEVSYDWQQTM